MNTVLPGSMLFGILNVAMIAKWYVLPKLKTLPLEDALIPLLIPHLFRYVGMAFLIPGVTRVALDSRFANPAAYGDLLAAVLAEERGQAKDESGLHGPSRGQVRCPEPLLRSEADSWFHGERYPRFGVGTREGP